MLLRNSRLLCVINASISTRQRCHSCLRVTSDQLRKITRKSSSQPVGLGCKLDLLCCNFALVDIFCTFFYLGLRVGAVTTWSHSWHCYKIIASIKKSEKKPNFYLKIWFIWIISSHRDIFYSPLGGSTTAGLYRRGNSLYLHWSANRTFFVQVLTNWSVKKKKKKTRPSIIHRWSPASVWNDSATKKFQKCAAPLHRLV